MFKKRNMYLILFFSLFELLSVLFLIKPDAMIIVGTLLTWFYFAWCLMEAFNIEEDVFIGRIYALKGINKDRKLGLLISTFGLIIMPVVLFWAWLSK